MTIAYPAINGNFFQHSSIKLFVNNDLLLGVKSINYKQTLTPAVAYGTSAKPIGRTKGKYTTSADMELYPQDYDNLLQTLGTSYMQAVFQIVVTYQDFNQTDRRDVLNGVRIMSDAAQSSEGEAPLSIKVELSVMEVLRNSTPAIV